MNCDSTRNSVQGLQSVILLINDTSSSSIFLSALGGKEKDYKTLSNRTTSRGIIDNDYKITRN